MARAIVTPEIVAAAAEALIAAGEEPSIVQVQAHIGGGSYTTVKRLLDDWKRERRSAAPALPLPPEIAARGDELLRSLWAAAVTLMEQHSTEVRAQAARQLRQAEASLQAAEATIDRLEREAEQATQEQRETRQQLAAAQRSVEEARTAVRVAEARASEQEQQIADLRQMVASQREELEAARALATEHARLTGELAALRRQLEDQATLIARLTAR